MTKQAPIQVAIAAESPLVVRGVRDLLLELPNLQAVGSSSDAAETLGLIQRCEPHVLVIDVPLLTRIAGLWRQIDKRPRLVLISYRAHAGVDLPCGRESACGMLQPKMNEDHLRAMLQVIATCETPTSGTARCAKCPARDSLRPPPLPLSAREREVFLRIGAGASNLVIARELGVSVKTIETHRENIKRKLGIDSAHGLLGAAVRWRRGDILLDRPHRDIPASA
jgi:DNA-binding NarL/FixJ family response regulator